MAVHTAHVIGDPADDDSLPALVDGVRTGRRGSLEALVSRIESRIRRWALRLTADADEADDVTQDVLITLERRVQHFAGRSEFSTWLFQVTRNAAVNRLRGDARRSAKLQRLGLVIERTEEPSQTLDDRRLAELVRRYVTELPPRQRQVFELADLGGYSPVEIAEMLGMETVTVRGNLFKARRAIRMRILEQHPKLLEEYLS
jgi:RNA polymerase sigma-70 factor (ECF subfamily)